MRTRYRTFEKNTVYFITSTIVDWYEIFVSEPYFDILKDSLNFKKVQTDLEIFAYVFMKNHFHMIISSNNVTKFIKEFKSFTARQIINQLKFDNQVEIINHFIQKKKSYKNESNYQVWQEGFHPELVINMEMFVQKADYIHNNPVKCGYVTKPEDWKYSSASNYLFGKGVIEIDFPDI